jgi:hypothetical protein
MVRYKVILTIDELNETNTVSHLFRMRLQLRLNYITCGMLETEA